MGVPWHPISSYTVDAPRAVGGAKTSRKAKTIISKSPVGMHTFESAAFERWVRTLAPANP